MTEILDRSRSLSLQEVEQELDQIAARHDAAGGFGMTVLHALSGQAEDLLRRVPQDLRRPLEEATRRALHVAMHGAAQSRRLVADQPSPVNRWLSASMGMMGGAGGLAGALVELPLTTTFLLRSIQGVALQHGFDPAAKTTQFDAMQVFASAGPMAQDDGTDTGFVSLRLAVNGAGMSRLISTVAPKLATALGPKLMAQSVPVLGALGGGAINYVYAGYYQEMAHVHFGLRRLALEADQPFDEMVGRLSNRLPLR